MNLQDEQDSPVSPVATSRTNDDELLGLDQQIKLTKRAKIAKIDQERIMDRNGVSYIATNYQKVCRIFAKHDKALSKRLQSKSLSSVQRKQLKYDNEFDNMSALLNFYQLWCHTLFPKANFRDCVQMIRGVTNRSPMLKIYRRELLDQEIYKMKVKKGIIDVPLEEQQAQQAQEDENVEIGGNNSNAADDDDWSFMNPTIPPNPLFLDDDVYTTPPEEPQPARDATESGPAADKERSQPQASGDDLEQLEEEFYAMSNENRNDDEEDYELHLMNEMDL